MNNLNHLGNKRGVRRVASIAVLGLFSSTSTTGSLVILETSLPQLLQKLVLLFVNSNAQFKQNLWPHGSKVEFFRLFLQTGHLSISPVY